MSQIIPCSALVLTRNSAGSLRACLESLKNIDEVIMVDGHSTDDTRAIAQTFQNVRIIDQDAAFAGPDGRIIDYGSVRNQGLREAKHQWIVMVDSDEELPSSFIEEVRNIVAANKPGAYNAFRRFVLNGVPVVHCAGYPAYQIRVFHTSLTNGFVKIVHERLDLKQGVEPRLLNSEILTPLPAPAVLWPKYERYLALEARRLVDLTPSRWLTHIVFRKFKTIVGLLLRCVKVRLVPRRGLVMPFAYEWQAVRYAWLLIFRTAPWRPS